MQYHTWPLVPFDVPGGTDMLDEIYTMLQLGCSRPRQGDQSGQSVNLQFSLSHTDPAGAHTFVTTGLKMQLKLSEQRVIKVKKPEVWYLLLTQLLSASMTGYELLIRIRHSCVTKSRVTGFEETLKTPDSNSMEDKECLLYHMHVRLFPCTKWPQTLRGICGRLLSIAKGSLGAVRSSQSQLVKQTVVTLVYF